MAASRSLLAAFPLARSVDRRYASLTKQLIHFVEIRPRALGGLIDPMVNFELIVAK
jgi:hypothetical protein